MDISSFAVQYTNVDHNQVAASSLDLFITEGDPLNGNGIAPALTDVQVQALVGQGKLVAGVVNAIFADDRRGYWNAAWTDTGLDTGTPTASAPQWVQWAERVDNDGVPGVDTLKLPIANPEWQQIIVAQSVDLVQRGYNAIFLDQAGNPGSPLEDTLARFIIDLKTSLVAINPDVQLIVNVDPVVEQSISSSTVLANAYRAAVDARLFYAEEYANSNFIPEGPPLVVAKAADSAASIADYWKNNIVYVAPDNSYMALGSSEFVPVPATAGDDVINGSVLGDMLNGLGGNDVISGEYGNDVLRGGDGNDLLVGGGGTNELWGDAGDDTLQGGSDADVWRGGTGDDTYIVGSRATIVEGAGEGVDTVVADRPYELPANVENLRLTSFYGAVGSGNELDNVIDASSLYIPPRPIIYGVFVAQLSGGAGDDHLIGSVFPDSLDGGLGADVLAGGGSSDRYIVDADDTIIEAPGGGDRDSVTASMDFVLPENVEVIFQQGAGNISATGNEGNNELHGNAGNNVLIGLGGDDIIDGGGGDDIMEGGDGNDRLSGGDGVGTLRGGAGNDILFGGLTIEGGDGNDTIYGGNGADTMIGGAGADIYRVDHAGDIIIDPEDDAYDSVYASIDYVIQDGVDIAYVDDNGGGLALTARATSGSWVIGGRGGDHLYGQSGIDLLDGREGDDILTPGRGNNYVDGGWGNDTLVLDGTIDSYSYFTSAERAFLVGGNGTTSIVDLEHVQFADGSLTFEQLASTLEAFDPLRYVAAHGDLIEAFGTDTAAATNHLVTYYMYEDRPAKAFDALQYTASHGDLIEAFGTDQQAAEAHYITYGFEDGVAQDTFDALRYIASNTDLIEPIGTDQDAAAAHFITTGFAQHRSMTAFDPLQYIASYEDLIESIGDNLEAGSAHYIDFGFGEGRAADSFDALRYVASHGDLIEAFGVDEDAAAEHYIRYGHETHSDFSFDALAYAQANPNIAAIYGSDVDALTRHFIGTGFAEGLIMG